MCKVEQLKENFNKNSRKFDGLQVDCRNCKKEYQKKWYFKNKKKHIDNCCIIRKNCVNENKKRIFDFLEKNPCVDCGETDPVVLEFDHQKDKINCISRLITSSWNILEKEIKKCEVRCANCHRRKTAKDFNWYKYSRSVAALTLNQ